MLMDIFPGATMLAWLFSRRRYIDKQNSFVSSEKRLWSRSIKDGKDDFGRNTQKENSPSVFVWWHNEKMDFKYISKRLATG